MVNLVAVHSMLVELHGGMLTLAAICIFLTVIARIHLRMRKTNASYGVFWPADSFVGKMVQYTEPTAYLAAIGGVTGLIASAIVGFYVWPIDFITSSSLALSKVVFSVFALELFVVFVLLRSRYGQNLWKNGGTAAVYACLGLIGFLLMVVAGSLGGHMALKGSVLDPVYSLVGINPENLGINLSNLPIITIGVSIVLLVVPILVFLYFQRRTPKVETKT